MRRHGSLLTSFVIVALMSSLVASASSAVFTQKSSLKIYSQAVVNGILLEPGFYRVELGPGLDVVTFARDGKVIASSPCKVGVVSKPATGNTVHSRPTANGREEITRIVFAGSSLSINLGTSPQTPPIAEAGAQH